ncbi:universal stress protein family protein [Janibacter sp. HTCC2649]|uniref:universal stress protein n=1 Tax=Janibacter sp. HTCC2649 TaxID=313589 RepID=UPI000067196F|nr:universal stress protein [Janibacter sp. HTCC2649]EAP97797.1 universal stress protein family protein [Janibacter sp. HTCC2649]
MTTTHQPQGAIVVGVHNRPSDDNAISQGIRQARLSHRPLHLIHALSPGIVPWTAEYIETKNLALKECRDRAAEKASDLDISCTLHVDEPAGVLVEASRSAALVILGSSGHSRSVDVARTAITRKVISHAASPVLVTPQFVEWDESGRIVVGVDATEHSMPALEWAFAEAAARNARLLAIQTWWWEAPASSLGGNSWDGDEVEVAESQRIQLTEMLAGWREKYPEVRVETWVTRGRAARVLEELSATARLVVVGTRGRGGFAGLLLGSVSDHVAHHGQCPVVVVPSNAHSQSQG